MALRKILNTFAACALVYGGWKAKGKADDMLEMPKPASVVGKLSQFWDSIYSGGGAAKQADESIRREVDRRVKAEMRKIREEQQEGQRRIIAALDEVKRSLDQRDGNNGSRPSPASTTSS